MKLFLTSITVMLALCYAEADTKLLKRPHQSVERGGGRAGRPSMGGGGLFGGEERLQNMIETQCNDPTTCNGVDSSSLDCTFETLVRPDKSDLNKKARAQAKEDFKAQKKENKENMVKCACCTSMSVEDILAAARPLGGSSGRLGGMNRLPDDESELASSTSSGDGDSMSSGDGITSSGDVGLSIVGGDAGPGGRVGGMVRLPGDESGLAGSTTSGDGDSMTSGDDGSTSSGDVGLSARTASRPLGGRGGSGGRPGGMGSGGGGFRPQSGEGGTDIEARLEEKCNEDGVDEKCTEMASQAQAMDCTKFDSMMSNLDDSMIDMNTRGGRRKTFFYCGCCRGSGGD